MLSNALSIAVLLTSIFSVAHASTVSVTLPRLSDTQGNPLSSVSAGQLVVISTNLVNSTPEATPFVVIIEARDEQGVTVYLQFATGTIESSGRSQIGQSWSPQQEGEYTLRTFAFTSFSEFEPLTSTEQSNVTITPGTGRPNFDVIIEGQ